MFCPVLDLIMVTGDGGLTGAPACTRATLRRESKAADLTSVRTVARSQTPRTSHWRMSRWENTEVGYDIIIRSDIHFQLYLSLTNP